jgi:hypothetical protein
MDRHRDQSASRRASLALARMGPPLSLAVLVLGFERAKLRLLLGKQFLDHRPFRGVSFRREQPSIVFDVEASDIFR